MEKKKIYCTNCQNFWEFENQCKELKITDTWKSSRDLISLIRNPEERNWNNNCTFYEAINDLENLTQDCFFSLNDEEYFSLEDLKKEYQDFNKTHSFKEMCFEMKLIYFDKNDNELYVVN